MGTIIYESFLHIQIFFVCLKRMEASTYDKSVYTYIMIN